MELMCVLVILMGLAVAASGIFSTYNRATTATRINNDVTVLFKAMSQYYQTHCTDTSFPTITLNDLYSERVLAAGNFQNPWGNDFQLFIDLSVPRNPQLRVSAVFDSVAHAEFVAGRGNNTTVSGSMVTWTFNGTLSNDEKGVELQMDRAIFGTNLC